MSERFYLGVGKSRYSPSVQRLPKACSDTPCMDTRIFVSISDWLVSYAPYDWPYSCKISKYKHCHVYNFFCSTPPIALHLKRFKRLCLICPCIVIYAVGSSKRETKQCYSQRDGNNWTLSPKLKVWNYLCDRPKTSTFAETEKTSITYRTNRKIGRRTEKP